MSELRDNIGLFLKSSCSPFGFGNPTQACIFDIRIVDSGISEDV
jgi:hypothetical protein